MTQPIPPATQSTTTQQQKQPKALPVAEKPHKPVKPSERETNNSATFQAWAPFAGTY